MNVSHESMLKIFSGTTLSPLENGEILQHATKYLQGLALSKDYPKQLTVSNDQKHIIFEPRPGIQLKIPNPSYLNNSKVISFEKALGLLQSQGTLHHLSLDNNKIVEKKNPASDSFIQMNPLRMTELKPSRDATSKIGFKFDGFSPEYLKTLHLALKLDKEKNEHLILWVEKANLFSCINLESHKLTKEHFLNNLVKIDLTGKALRFRVPPEKKKRNEPAVSTTSGTLQPVESNNLPKPKQEINESKGPVDTSTTESQATCLLIETSSQLQIEPKKDFKQEDT